MSTSRNRSSGGPIRYGNVKRHSALDVLGGTHLLDGMHSNDR